MAPEHVEITAEGDVVAQVREHARDGAQIHCVGVLEHVGHFVPVVEALVEAAEAGATVLLGVPNTPVTGTRGASTWGEGALEELRGLLPADHIVLHEIPLRGAVTLPADGAATLALEVAVDGHATPSLFLAAFGPRAAELTEPHAEIHPADLTAELAEARRLRADVAFLEARVRELEARLGPTAQLPAPA